LFLPLRRKGAKILFFLGGLAILRHFVFATKAQRHKDFFLRGLATLWHFVFANNSQRRKDFFSSRLSGLAAYYFCH
jgi:hypothetical protein